jgi:hypothetical protein
VFNVQKQIILSHYPHAPELCLNVGVGLEGYFDRGVVALACDALGLGLGPEVAGCFHRDDDAPLVAISWTLCWLETDFAVHFTILDSA